jgi:acetyl esterase/lipase
LAALLGMEDSRDNSDPALAKYSSRVQAVVDVSGPTDFTTVHDPDGAAFLTSFFGASFTKDPEVWRDASPAFHAAKSDAPFLIVHGTHDERVPISQAQELCDKLRAAGVPASFVRVDEGHTFQSREARRTLAIKGSGILQPLSEVVSTEKPSHSGNVIRSTSTARCAGARGTSPAAS